MEPNYSILIEWSVEDQEYVATSQCHDFETQYGAGITRQAAIADLDAAVAHHITERVKNYKEGAPVS